MDHDIPDLTIHGSQYGQRLAYIDAALRLIFMTNFDELKRRIDDIGRICRREESFYELQALSNSTSRVICGESAAFQPRGVVPTGLSFWVHDADDVAFLGFWNGRLFVLPNHDNQLTSLCVELLCCEPHSAGPHTSISDPVQSQYSLREIELLHLSDIIEDDWNYARDNSAITSRQVHDLIEKLKSLVDRVDKFDGRTLEVILGEARAIGRVFDTHPCGFVSFVVHGGLRDSDDDIQLLHCFQRSSTFAMYDGCWVNRIELSDPYYDFPTKGARPTEPRNWAISNS